MFGPKSDAVLDVAVRRQLPLAVLAREGATRTWIRGIAVWWLLTLKPLAHTEGPPDPIPGVMPAYMGVMPAYMGVMWASCQRDVGVMPGDTHPRIHFEACDGNFLAAVHLEDDALSVAEVCVLVGGGCVGVLRCVCARGVVVCEGTCA